MISFVISAEFLTVNVHSRITSLEQCTYSTTDGTCGGGVDCFDTCPDAMWGACPFYSCAGLQDAMPYTFECYYNGFADIARICTEDDTDPESCEDYELCATYCEGLTCEDQCLTTGKSFPYAGLEYCNATDLGRCESNSEWNFSTNFTCVQSDDGADSYFSDNDINDECNYDLCRTICYSGFGDGTCEGDCTTEGYNLVDTNFGDCDDFFAEYAGYEKTGNCFNYRGAGVTLTCNVNNAKSSLDIGMIIGIVVGAVVLICIILAVVYKRPGKL